MFVLAVAKRNRSGYVIDYAKNLRVSKDNEEGLSRRFGYLGFCDKRAVEAYIYNSICAK